MKTRAVLYARVSGDDHDEASKLDAQIAMCREYAGKQGYTILHEFQEDKYSSGADLDLPHLNEALDLARDGAFDILVCRELDRLARETGIPAEKRHPHCMRHGFATRILFDTKTIGV